MLTARTCSHHMILTRITWSSRDACGRAWLFCSPDDSMTWPSGRRYATSLACVSFLTARQVGYRFSSVGLFSGHTDALHIPGVCVFSDRTTGPWRFTSVGVFSDHTDTLQIPGVCVFSDRTTGPWPFHLRGCLFCPKSLFLLNLVDLKFTRISWFTSRNLLYVASKKHSK